MIQELCSMEVQLHCEAAIEIAGQRLTPSRDTSYLEFRLSHAFTTAHPTRTYYGTAIHPGTLANSYRTLLHKVLNKGHLMKSYGKVADATNRDHILGTVVAVEFPKAPQTGWDIHAGSDQPIGIRAAAVIHKASADVPEIFQEHLSGRHHWTVSQEINFNAGLSGLIVHELDKATPGQKELLRATPPEFQKAGLGYLPYADAPADLQACWNVNRHRVETPWGACPVTLLKNGINGEVSYQGVGVVRYGQERAASIETLLAGLGDEDAARDELLRLLAYAQGTGRHMLDALRGV